MTDDLTVPPNGHSDNAPDGDAWAAALPGYERLTVVGSGGTATVFSATRSADGAAVAIKVFDASESQAFDRQLKASERLADVPGILAVDDHGTLPDGRCYTVSPFAHGGSLGARLTRFGPLAPDEVARLGARLASSLDAAHRAGVLHRDLKPSNVLLADDGVPLLADFGAATVAKPETASATMAVTVLYAAPEVLEGAAADARSDVYSLGLTLLAVATGSHPFGTPSETGLATLVNRICGTGVPDPAGLGLPAGLAAVLRTATQLDPAARYRSAADMAAALDEVGEHPDTAPAGSPASAEPTARRAPATRWLAGAAALLAVAVIAGAVWWAQSGDDGANAADATSSSVPTTLTDPVTEANGILGPLYQQDRWTYVGHMTEECPEDSRRIAMSIRSDEDDRAAGIATPWEAAAGEEVGVWFAYLPCEAGGTEVRYVLRGPGRWFTLIAEFTQDQYDRIVAWSRENESSPAPDFSVDMDHVERLQDPENYLGWSIIDRPT